MIYKFPKDFLWGTATAAHQIEGNNKNSDWWEYEQTKEMEGRTFPLEPSLDACDSYNRYEEDFDLAKNLNTNAIRFSIEWARLEPKEGEWDKEQVEHYRKMLQAAKDRGLKTYVTLHHFTNPIWFAKRGGWHAWDAPKYFDKYAKRFAESFDDLIDAYLTINEPQVYTLLGYQGVYDWRQGDVAQWPPAKKNLFQALIVQINFMRAHIKAFKTIKKYNKQARVGIVKNISWFETDPYDPKFLDVFATKVLNFLNKGFYIIPLKRYMDFLGLNYYFTNRITNLKQNNPNDYVSDLEWWINPGGLERILRYLKTYKIPIYVTENGLADAQDKLRKHFLKDHLVAIAKAIEDGVDVRGYFHWSLIDNYEWHEGFWPRFGLVEIDRENNLERKPRDSYYYYADICKKYEVDDTLN